MTDANDNAPVFSVAPIYHINVSETAVVESEINLDNILATDNDKGNFYGILFVSNLVQDIMEFWQLLPPPPKKEKKTKTCP